MFPSLSFFNQQTLLFLSSRSVHSVDFEIILNNYIFLMQKYVQDKVK